MSAKDGVLLIKLKDGIQDTVVFLRMLEQFKIPAVMETRRKKLLEKLLHLQGDTIRETPPSYENGDATTPTTSPEREKGELTRKGSVVDTKVSEYSRIETKAKEQMATFSPKKTAGTTSDAAKKEEAPAAAEEVTDYLEPASVLKRPGKDNGAASTERPASTVSSEAEAKKEDTEQVEESSAAAAGAGEGKGKKKRFGGGGLKGLRSKIGKRSKKPASAAEVEGGEPENGEPEAAEGDDGAPGVEGETKEEEKKVEETGGEVAEEKEEEEQEEGVRIASQLEKRVPKRLGKSFNWIKITGKLKETTLILMAGSKDKELELAGCMVSPSDAAPNGIELFSHKEQKQWVFRVETSELRERWVEELQKAIDTCPTEPTPAEAPAESAQPEEQQDEQQPPQEKVEEPPPPAIIEPSTTSDEENTSPLKKKRTSFAVSPNRAAKSKPVNEIPEQGVQMRGYVHRKKGTFGGWEKAYAVVTYAAIYFTSGEEVREYHHVCLLNGSGTVKLEKKGHDKQSEGLLVRSGKNKETLSLPSSEVNSWRQIMEEVLGVAQGSLEFGSDEEGEGAEPPSTVPRIEEDQDLYEELPAGEEIEEDIYEEFDDVKPSSSPPKAPPSLPPPRQEQQRAPSPALPPRNDRSGSTGEPVPSLPPRPSPSLPPRNSPTPTPKLTPQLKKTAAPPPTQPDVGGEELYEDVVAPPTSTANADVAEEMYEDVVAPQGARDKGGEELYEDVVAPPGQTKVPDSPTEDYTEMDIGQGVPEDYVVMEKPKGDEEELEVYCEVDSDSPSHAPVNSITLPPKGVAKSPVGSKIVKPPPPASYTPRHSGSLNHKAPKKSKFYEEWCAVEGTNLCFYKNQKEKRASEKLSLNEFDMTYSPADKEGKFAFRLTKGDRVHHFTPGSKEDLSSWISALRGLAKSATLELPSGEQQIYETTKDHTAESDEQITFKAGSYIRIISRGASDMWIGQLGSTPQVFTGKIGKFPAAKVTLAEDLYI